VAFDRTPPLGFHPASLIDAFSGRLLPVVKPAQRLQVSAAVVVSATDVVNVGRSLGTSGFLADASSVAEDLVSDLLPVGRQIGSPI
jgi:hypothetical protein